MNTVSFGTNVQGWNGSGRLMSAAGEGKGTAENCARMGMWTVNGLRSVDWRSRNIFSVVMSFVCSGAWSSHEKPLHIYLLQETELIDGRDAAWAAVSAGTFLGACRCAKSYKDGTANSVTFSPSSNAQAFALMEDYLRNGTGCVWAIRNGSANELVGIRDIIVSVSFEPRGSTGTLDRESVTPGGTVTLDIEPVEAEGGTLRHDVSWTLGSKTVTHRDVGNETDSLTLEASDEQYITGGSGTLVCALTTYINGVETGTQEMTAAVTLPASWIPVINRFDAARYKKDLDGNRSEDITGGHVWFGIDISCAGYSEIPAGRRPTVTLTGVGQDSGDCRTYTWSDFGGTSFTLTKGQAGSYPFDEDTQPFAAGEAWRFTLTVSDPHQTVTAFYDGVTKSWVTMHIAGNGHGIGIGTYVTDCADENASQWNRVVLGDGWKIQGSAGGEEYSTSEQEVGKWVNGETLYRKVLIASVSASTSNWQYVGGIDGNIKSLTGVIDRGTLYMPIPFYRGSSSFVHLDCNEGSVVAQSAYAGTIICIVLYTKNS